MWQVYKTTENASDLAVHWVCAAFPVQCGVHSNLTFTANPQTIKTIKISGRIGYGKITLLNGNSLDSVRMLLLMLRRYHGKAEVEYYDQGKLQLCNTGDLCHGVGTENAFTGGIGACTVIALVEYPCCTESLLKLLKGSKLPDSVVNDLVVNDLSQPADTYHLRWYATKQMEIPEIQRYIQEDNEKMRFNQAVSRKDVDEVFDSIEFSFNSLDLLTKDKLFYRHGLKETYSCARLMFQEFLAAYHLEDIHQIEGAEEHTGDKHMGVVLVSYVDSKDMNGEVAMDAYQNQYCYMCNIVIVGSYSDDAYQVLLQEDQFSSSLDIHENQCLRNIKDLRCVFTRKNYLCKDTKWDLGAGTCSDNDGDCQHECNKTSCSKYLQCSECKS